MSKESETSSPNLNNLPLISTAGDCVCCGLDIDTGTGEANVVDSHLQSLLSEICGVNVLEGLMCQSCKENIIILQHWKKELSSFISMCQKNRKDMVEKTKGLLLQENPLAESTMKNKRREKLFKAESVTDTEEKISAQPTAVICALPGIQTNARNQKAVILKLPQHATLVGGYLVAYHKALPKPSLTCTEQDFVPLSIILENLAKCLPDPNILYKTKTKQDTALGLKQLLQLQNLPIRKSNENVQTMNKFIAPVNVVNVKHTLPQMNVTTVKTSTGPIRTLLAYSKTNNSAVHTLQAQKNGKASKNKVGRPKKAVMQSSPNVTNVQIPLMRVDDPKAAQLPKIQTTPDGVERTKSLLKNLLQKPGVKHKLPETNTDVNTPRKKTKVETPKYVSILKCFDQSQEKTDDFDQEDSSTWVKKEQVNDHENSFSGDVGNSDHGDDDDDEMGLSSISDDEYRNTEEKEHNYFKAGNTGDQRSPFYRWNPDKLRCKFCQIVKEHAWELLDHLSKAHHKNSKFTCIHCRCMFHTEKSRDEHQKIAHPEINLIYCTACHGPGMNTMEEFKEHEVKCREFRKYQCHQCLWAFAQKQTLTRHLQREEHKGMICRLCEKEFLDPREYTTHMNMETNVQISCYICGKVFKHPSTVTQHVKRSHNTTEKLCFICGWKTLRVDSYKRHMRLHKEGGYVCDLCGFGSQSPTQHKLHTSSHIPYACPRCNKVIVGQLPMRRHHANCDGIGADITKDSSLTQNKTSTSEIENLSKLDASAGGNNFKCNGCNRTLKGNEAIRHFNRKPSCSKFHRCLYCSVLFSETESLKKHEATHKGPFICSYCHRGFLKWDKCTKHMTQHVKRRIKKRKYMKELDRDTRTNEDETTIKGQSESNEGAINNDQLDNNLETNEPLLDGDLSATHQQLDAVATNAEELNAAEGTPINEEELTRDTGASHVVLDEDVVANLVLNGVEVINEAELDGEVSTVHDDILAQFCS